MFFLIVSFRYASLHNEKKHQQRGETLQLGVNNGPKIYQAPDYYKQKNIFIGPDGKKYAKMGNTCWFTNLDHGRRHEPLQLMTMTENKRFNKQVKKDPNCYKKYDNYNAIEVPYTSAIPSDYDGVMGVPVSFLDKYNPEQFQILGSNRGVDQDPNKIYGRGSYLNGKEVYKRIFIRHKKK